MMYQLMLYKLPLFSNPSTKLEMFMKRLITICLLSLFMVISACSRLSETSLGDNSATIYHIIQNPRKESNIDQGLQKIQTTKRKLETFAQSKMNDLIATNCWSHTNSNGCDFKCRTSSYLQDYSWIGENLYRGVCDLDNAYRLWRESPSHLAILNHSYDKQVILMQEYSAGKCYIVLERAISIGY